jgi:hypothetical protein
MDRRHFKAAAATALLIALAYALLALGDTASAYDYVPGGGFESGTDGWRAAQADLSAVDASVVTPADGAYSARIVLGSSPASLSPPGITVGPGTYTFSARVRRTILADGISLQATLDGTASLAVEAEPGVDEWVPVSTEVAVTSWSFMNLYVRFAGTAGDFFYVDDVRFEGAAPVTPLPSASPTLAASATAPATTTGTPTPTPTATLIPIGPALRNTGFEDVAADGAPEGWAHFGGRLSAATSPARGGALAARLESTTASTKWLYQAVTVAPGAAYEFAAWLFDADDHVASAFLRVSWYASDDGSGTSIGSLDSVTRIDAPQDGYQRLTTGGVVAPSAARSAKLRVILAPVSEARAVIYVDDASFGATSAAPTPATDATAPPADAGSGGSEAAPPGSSAVLGATTRQRAATTAPPTATDRRSTSRVVINEVMYDPEGDTSDSAGEWVELYNAGAVPVDLGGWTLSDSASGDVLPQVTILQNEMLIIAASDSLPDAYPAFSGRAVVLGGRIGNALGNDGDSLVLRDASGAAADAISWGSDTSVFAPAIADVPAGHSIERRIAGSDTDNASDWIDNDRPSPGLPIAAAAGKPQRLNGGTPPRIIAAGGGSRFAAWAPWLVAAVASTALAGVASARILPLAAQRLRRHA